MSGVWSKFSDIMNFKYDASEVDKDIRHLLKTGEFKPAYTDMVRNFLVPEIENCKHTLEDENHLLEVHLQGSMSEDALTRTPEEITPILDWLDYSSDKRQFWFDYYVHPKHGRQKAPPISVLQNGNKKVIITPFGLTVDAFYSVYTEIHELMHGVQGKYHPTSKEKEAYKNNAENLEADSILMSINGTIGNVALYNNEPIMLGKSACYINSKDNVDKKLHINNRIDFVFLDYAKNTRQ